MVTACQRPSRHTKTRVYQIRPANGKPRMVPVLSAIARSTATSP